MKEKIKDKILRKELLTIAVMVVVTIVGLFWFAKGWTPLGLPVWVGAAVAVVVAAWGVWKIFHLENRQKKLLGEEKKTEARTEPKSEPETKTESDSRSEPVESVKAESEKEVKPVNRMTRAYINSALEEADDALVEAEDVMSAAEALEDEAVRLKAEYEAKLAKAKARRAAKK